MSLRGNYHDHNLANPSTLYRGSNTQDREKRVSESKNAHIPNTKEGILNKKSPGLSRAPQGKLAPSRVCVFCGELQTQPNLRSHV